MPIKRPGAGKIDLLRRGVRVAGDPHFPARSVSGFLEGLSL